MTYEPNLFSRRLPGAEQRQHPEAVFLPDEEVDIEYESTAYYKLLEKKNPLIWFSRVKGYPDFQLVTNVMGSRARMAFALGHYSESKFSKPGMKS